MIARSDPQAQPADQNDARLTAPPVSGRGYVELAPCPRCGLTIPMEPSLDPRYRIGRCPEHHRVHVRAATAG